MTKAQLFKNILAKKSFLCVGLDPDLSKLPAHLLGGADPVFQFNKEIIDATKDFCVAYKVNTAFYECLGVSGWNSMDKTLRYINESTENVLTIADAKRGDIGNTSKMYAKTFFEQMPFDALTVAPYMGSDSVLPFLDYKEKWVILLALTSNAGADDFQKLELKSADGTINTTVFNKVLETSKTWGTAENMMYVVGATQAVLLQEIRKIVPHHFLLIPGVGAQGGSLEEVVKYGMNAECGLLVNSSRNIIYAGNDQNFGGASGNVAKEMQQEMAHLLNQLV